MRKFIIIGATLAALVATPSIASANVDRYQEQTGTITVKLPEYNLVHTFKDVVVNPCDGGSFTATGERNVGGVEEKVSGTIKNGKVEFEAGRLHRL